MPNDKQLYHAEGRKDVFMIPTDRVTIVEDPKSPLYDERIKLPVDPALVKSIKVHGVKVPIVVWRDGDVVYVVDGRQRLRALVQANKELEAEGAEPHYAPCMPHRASDASKLADLVIMLNEIRRQDDPVTRAQKMQRLADLGRDEEQIALAFGCSESTVRNMLSILELAPQVQKAIKVGELPASLAPDLARLPREEQVAKLEELKQAPHVKGEARRGVIRGEGTTADAVGKLSKRDYWLLLQALAGEGGQALAEHAPGTEIAALKRKLKPKAGDYAPPKEGEEQPKRKRARA